MNFPEFVVVAREILDTNENSLKRWQQRTVIKQANRLYVTKRDSSWRWKTAKTATMKFTLKLSSREPYKEVDCNVVNCISGSKAQRFPALHFNAASRPILRFYLSLSLSLSLSLALRSVDVCTESATKFRAIFTKSHSFWLLRYETSLRVHETFWSLFIRRDFLFFSVISYYNEEHNCIDRATVKIETDVTL